MNSQQIYSTFETRIRAVNAFLKGISVSTIAEVHNINRSTVYRWLKREQTQGVDGLQRSESPGSGRPRKIQKVDSDILSEIISQDASNFGYETNLWTCRRILQVLKSKFHDRISRQTVWRRLREADLTYQKPERRYLEASAKERQEWEKKELPKIRACVRKHKAILYFEDEANISLTAVVGKTWAPRGKTPTHLSTGSRGGISAISAVSKDGRLVFKLLDKRINSDDIINFLEQILRHHLRRHIVVVMDQASPHTSKKTRDFILSKKRLHVFYLPKYSPDWNPDEKIWNHLKHQEMKSHQARTKDELKRLTHRKLKKMQRNPSQVRGIFFRCIVANLLD